MNLFIVRHGLVASNLEPGESYNLDPSVNYASFDKNVLTSLGQAQATLTGLRLSKIKIDYVFSSPTARTLKTAANICMLQPECPHINIYPELHECGSYGYEMISEENLKMIWPDISIVPGYVPKGFCDECEEDRVDRADRINMFLTDNFKESDNVLLVTHGHFCGSYLIPALLEIPRELRPKYCFLSENAAVSVISKKEDGKIIVKSIDECGYMHGNVSREPFTLF